MAVDSVLGRVVVTVVERDELPELERDILPVVVVCVSGRAVTVLGREVVVLVPVLGRAVTVLPREEPVEELPEVTFVEERCIELVAVLSLLLLMLLVEVRAELGVATLCLLLEADREVVLVVLLLVVGL